MRNRYCISTICCSEIYLLFVGICYVVWHFCLNERNIIEKHLPYARKANKQINITLMHFRSWIVLVLEVLLILISIVLSLDTTKLLLQTRNVVTITINDLFPIRAVWFKTDINDRFMILFLKPRFTAHFKSILFILHIETTLILVLPRCLCVFLQPDNTQSSCHCSCLFIHTLYYCDKEKVRTFYIFFILHWVCKIMSWEKSVVT